MLLKCKHTQSLISAKALISTFERKIFDLVQNPGVLPRSLLVPPLPKTSFCCVVRWAHCGLVGSWAPIPAALWWQEWFLWLRRKGISWLSWRRHSSSNNDPPRTCQQPPRRSSWPFRENGLDRCFSKDSQDTGVGGLQGFATNYCCLWLIHSGGSETQYVCWEGAGEVVKPEQWRVQGRASSSWNREGIHRPK